MNLLSAPVGWREPGAGCTSTQNLLRHLWGPRGRQQPSYWHPQFCGIGEAIASLLAPWGLRKDQK